MEVEINVYTRNQRLNTWWEEQVKASITCFYTVMCMFYSRWLGHEAVSDLYVKNYIDKTEILVGCKKWVTQVLLKFPWINGRTGAWWLVHQEAGNKVLKDFGLRLVYRETTFSVIEETIKKKFPVPIGTRLTHGGHVVLLIGFKFIGGKRYWKIADSWGKWEKGKGYVDKTTLEYWVLEKDLIPFVGDGKGSKIRTLIAEGR